MIKKNTILNYFKKSIAITLIFTNFISVNAQTAKPKANIAKPIKPTEVKKTTTQVVRAKPSEVSNISESKVAQILSPKFLPLIYIQKNIDLISNEYKNNIFILNEHYALDYNTNAVDLQKKIIEINGGIRLEEQEFYTYYLPKVELLDKEELTIERYFQTFTSFISQHSEILIYAPKEFSSSIYVNDDINKEFLKSIFEKQMNYKNIIKLN